MGITNSEKLTVSRHAANRAKKIGCACARPVTSIGLSVYFVRINLIQEAGKCAWALLIPCEHLELDQGVQVAVNKKREAIQAGTHSHWASVQWRQIIRVIR